jgi:hypothetical protein
MYYCTGWVPTEEEVNDSTAEEGEEIEYDENGYPLLPPNNEGIEDNPEEPSVPNNDQVILDNL